MAKAAIDSNQFALFEPPAEPPPAASSLDLAVHRLFFLIRPPPELVTELARLAREWCGPLDDARLMAAGNLHLSLCGVGKYPVLPREVVDLARRAGAAVSAAPFNIALDRLECWPADGHYTIVLRCGTGTTGFASLRAAIVGNLAGQRFASQWAAETPHLTLWRTARQALPRSLPHPVGWRVDHFCLVDSAFGAHRLAGQWDLTAAPDSARPAQPDLPF